MSARTLTVNTALFIVNTFCTNAPVLCCVPPDTRRSESTAGAVGPTGTIAPLTYASSLLSPSTRFQSRPALK